MYKVFLICKTFCYYFFKNYEINESLNFSLCLFNCLFKLSTAMFNPSSKVLVSLLTINSCPGILILTSVILFSLSLVF